MSGESNDTQRGKEKFEIITRPGETKREKREELYLTE